MHKKVQSMEGVQLLKSLCRRTFQAGTVSGFRGLKDHELYDPKAVYMFQIRGDSDDNARALQVYTGWAGVGGIRLIVGFQPLMVI